MKNKLRRVALKSTATAVSLSLGTAHLVFKSLADMSVSAEAHLLHKIIGKDKEGKDLISIRELKAERLRSTKETQAQAIKYAKMPMEQLPKRYQELVKSFKANSHVEQTV